MTERRPTAADRKLLSQYHYLAENLRDLEDDLRWGLDESPRIPAEWSRIAQSPVEPFKTKLTMRVDDDVLAFFKAMGRGHLTRMNAVLRAFMQARLAGVVKGPEDVVYRPTPTEEYMVKVAELMVLVSKSNARKRAGLFDEADDVEIDKMTARLVQMERHFEFPAEARIVSSGLAELRAAEALPQRR